MWRYPDGTFRLNGPARVERAGYIRAFADLTREERDELGYNEAVMLTREPFTAYETRWVKGEDLIWREQAVSAVKDEAARAEAEAAAVRAERDRLLAAGDWTQVADSPLDEAGKAAWAAYRQALRDVPQQAGFPDEVAWPAEPGA